jgi:DNA (cytosine-5)-methyltransferase 1
MHDSHGTPHAVCITGDKTHCLKAEGFDGACNNPNSNPNGSNSPAIAHNYRVRRLTPLECERLQGLPDGWTAGGSDTARYKAIGNSIAIPPVRWILKQIREAPDA